MRKYFLLIIFALLQQVGSSQNTLQEIDHSGFSDLLKTHVSKNGNVDYSGFKNDREKLSDYIDLLSKHFVQDSWTKKQKLAYWINAYNALTIDLILKNPTVNSIKDIEKPWDQRLWKLGDNWYSLNEIEHQILRKMEEPLIHFAIVCASVSCPKLQNEAFTSENLDEQLTLAAKEFLSDTSKNFISEDSLKLSKIFKWFAKDFKQGQSLVEFLNTYSDIEISKNASIRYLDYNWDLND